MKKIIKINLLFSAIISLLILTSCKKHEIPVVSTTAVSGITTTTATSGGNITSDGNRDVTARGVCWSTAQKPTITDPHTSDSNGTGTFASALTGLLPGTTYNVRAYATNSEGTAYGSSLSFVTLGHLPITTTNDATNIQTTGATLNGTVNPNYLSTAVTFEYGLTTSYGTSVTATQSPATGSSSLSVSFDLTGLNPGTIYHFRVKTVNTLGTVYGDDKSFTTLGQLSSATTTAATNVQLNSATLNGTVNANLLSTTVTFEYGLTVSYGSTVSATPSPVTGSTATSVNANISSLLPGTQYHFRVKAVNAIGTTSGNDLTFTTTGQAPSATTLAATNILTTGATVNGSVNANLLSTTVTFEYGLTTGYGSSIAATPGTVTGSTATSVSADLSALAPGTLYHFRVKAVNILGTTNGDDMLFTTGGGAPSAATVAATSVQGLTATVNGTVNANDVSTVVSFEYGTTTSYGNTATASQSPVTGTTATSVSADLSGLSPVTLYHFRVKAVNSIGTTYGDDMTFTTVGQVPYARTRAASGVLSTTATLNGTINAYYLPTTVTFEYGLDATYGSTVTAAQSPVTGNTQVSVSADISGLTPSTLYHFRVKGVNALGTTNGLDLTLTTGAK
jgi:phosphodiesterase/alkaline phosphatase D-like protein